MFQPTAGFIKWDDNDRVKIAGVVVDTNKNVAAFPDIGLPGGSYNANTQMWFCCSDANTPAQMLPLDGSEVRTPL